MRDTPASPQWQEPEEPPWVYEEDDEISLLDILLVVTRNRRLIGVTLLVSMIMGLLVAVTAPNEYTTSAKVIREGETESGGLSGGLAALRGFGINVGGGSTGLTAEAYPDIIKSREVRLAVARDTFFISELGRSMTFVEYVNRPMGWLTRFTSTVRRFTIGLPSILMAALYDERTRPVQEMDGEVPLLPTEAEERAMKLIDKLVSTSVDRETGLMTLRATAGDPLIAASLTESYLEQLSERVRTIRTEKAKQNLAFMQERFEEAEMELIKAEEELVRFLDRNNNPQTAQLRTELERLQRAVSFKSQLYSELQKQVTQAEIELQRSQPVVTILEKPVPPVNPSGPRRTLTVLLGIIVGGMLGIGFAIAKSAFDGKNKNDQEREKLEEIRASFRVPAFLRRFGRASRGAAKAGRKVS